jgi:signal transduction histidine kinase
VSLETCLSHSFIASHLVSRDREAILVALAPEGPAEIDLNLLMRRADGGRTWLRMIGTATSDGRMRGTMFDVTKTHELELQLRQSQKLESVGRLASGVAHEINTPVQFVNDSVHFARDAFTEMAPLLVRYEALARDVVAGRATPDEALALAQAFEDRDIAYFIESVPTSLERAVDGLSRIADIVRSMKEFAHPDQKEMRPIDINHALETTLIMAKNEYKYVADIETHFGELPPVNCRGGEMNQVFLNIIVNAAHAIGEVAQGGGRGTISVSTRVDGSDVVVAIRDTGTGIPDAIRDRIFDPFFTTKEVGKGTGQGLPIARSVVVDKQGGELYFESEPGRGTTFFVRLPIEGRRGVTLTQEWSRPLALASAA